MDNSLMNEWRASYANAELRARSAIRNFDYCQERVDAFIFDDSRMPFGCDRGTVCVLKDTGETMTYKQFMRSEYNHAIVGFRGTCIKSSCGALTLPEFCVNDYVSLVVDRDGCAELKGRVVDFFDPEEAEAAVVFLRAEGIDKPVRILRSEIISHRFIDPPPEEERALRRITPIERASKDVREAIELQRQQPEKDVTCPKCGVRIRFWRDSNSCMWYCPCCRAASTMRGL